eukprot:495660-Prymnesium_polylepis.1
MLSIKKYAGELEQLVGPVPSIAEGRGRAQPASAPCLVMRRLRAAQGGLTRGPESTATTGHCPSYVPRSRAWSAIESLE